MRKLLIGSAFGALLAAGPVLADRDDVVVRVAPPAAIVETRPVAPGAGYVWQPGYHRWNGSAYNWTAGSWVVGPRAGAVWVPHRWVRRRGGWVMVEGRWR